MAGLTLESALFLFLIIFWTVVIVWFLFPKPKRKIRFVTITGPSGSGKTTIVGEMLKRHPEWGVVVSLTSREPRAGRDLLGEYRCDLSVKYLERLNQEGKALWLERAHGNVYVTLFRDVNVARVNKVLSFMQILPKSVIKLRSYIPDEVLSIFIVPPGEEELRRRLTARDDLPEQEQIERRIADCKKWVEEARLLNIYEFVENNGAVEEAVDKVEEIIAQRIYPR